jgi:hypothetical protein
MFCWLVGSSLGVVGCTSLLERDFEKAMLISDVELGNPRIYTRTLAAQGGIARLILAVPNHRCSPPADGPVSFAVRVDNTIVLSERRRLSELTWSHGEGSCDALGYVAGNAGRIDLKDGHPLVTFEIDVGNVQGGSMRRASVWLIYGDRIPTAKIFGATK